MEYRYKFTMPVWWELLIIIAWAFVFFKFVGYLLYNGSAIAWVLYILGIATLFNCIQNIRWHKSKRFSWKGEHKICLAWTIIYASVSLLILIAVILDSMRGLI